MHIKSCLGEVEDREESGWKTNTGPDFPEEEGSCPWKRTKTGWVWLGQSSKPKHPRGQLTWREKDENFRRDVLKQLWDLEVMNCFLMAIFLLAICVFLNVETPH